MWKKRLFAISLIAMLLCSMLAGSLITNAAADAPTTHIVRRGQTLFRISRMYGVTVQGIVDANNLRDRNLIYVGQELIIPETPEKDYVKHVVQQGDTLFSIAARYGVSVWDIAQRNGIRNPNLIFVGDTLIIPSEANDVPKPPVTRPDVPEAIIITSPIMHQEITSPVTVTGWGSGFEQNLSVDVLDQEGNVIGQGYVMIDAELGQDGPFTGTITFTPPDSDQLGRVSVYNISPRDGAIEHLASVTVNLKP